MKFGLNIDLNTPTRRILTVLILVAAGSVLVSTQSVRAQSETGNADTENVVDAAEISLGDPAANSTLNLIIPPPLTEIPAVVQSVVPTPDITATSWMLVDFESGWILGSENRDQRIEPASLTKLMTSFLVFEALVKGEIKLSDQVYVSKKAWKTGGSRMFIQVDSRVDVESLLKGLIIQSGNDAAVALAEYLGGSEEGFAVRMNSQGSRIGDGEQPLHQQQRSSGS